MTTGEYTPAPDKGRKQDRGSPALLRAAFAVLEPLQLGRTEDVRVTGLGDLRATLAASDTGGVIATSHASDADVPVIAGRVADHADVVVAVLAQNWETPQRFAYNLLGGEARFPRVGWHKNDSGVLVPDHFDPRQYQGLVGAVQAGKTAIIAGEKPHDRDDPPRQVGELSTPGKAGVLAPHISLMTGAPLIPALSEIEGLRKHQEWNPGGCDLPYLRRKKMVHVGFGEAIIPEDEDVDRYADLMSSPGKADAARRDGRIQERAILKKYGAQVIESLRDMQWFT